MKFAKGMMTVATLLIDEPKMRLAKERLAAACLARPHNLRSRFSAGRATDIIPDPVGPLREVQSCSLTVGRRITVQQPAQLLDV